MSIASAKKEKGIAWELFMSRKKKINKKNTIKQQRCKHATSEHQQSLMHFSSKQAPKVVFLPLVTTSAIASAPLVTTALIVPFAMNALH